MSDVVFVVGGAGYIGSHTAKALHAAGLRPVVLDNLSRGHAHAVKWGPLERVDIRDRAALVALLAKHRPAAVMHFAARIEVGEGEREPEAFWDNNVNGVWSLLSAMRETGVSRFIFSSTCATYGEPARLPLREDNPQLPINCYGRTKLAVERMLGDFRNAYGLDFAILRYFNAAGADPEGEIGEEHDPETHLIPNALKAAAGIGGAMRLFGEDYPTPDGTCLRDFIHVSDLAAAHLLSLRRLQAGPDGFAVNVGTGRPVSVKQVIEAAGQAVGRPAPFEIHPRRAGDPPALYADVTRATELLGFRPQRSDIATIMQDAWRFHRMKWGVGA